jgi:hypothetical protein
LLADPVSEFPLPIHAIADVAGDAGSHPTTVALLDSAEAGLGGNPAAVGTEKVGVDHGAVLAVHAESSNTIHEVGGDGVRQDAGSRRPQ